MNTRAYRRLFGVLMLVGGLAGAGCAGVKPIATDGKGGSSATGGAGSTASGGSNGSGGTVVIMPAGCNGPCTDFEPTADNPNPIFGVNVPTSVTGMFGTPSGNGPCVTEPEDGALFPNNWLPPRIHVPGYSSSGYLKISFHADMESTDLVAYSQGDSWALPKPVWQKLAQHIVEEDVTVTVQTPGGGATVAHFQVAPVGAGGSMVFWSADPNQVGKTGVETMAQSAIVNDSYLLGFSVGDNSTVQTLNIEQVQQQTSTQSGSTQGSHCIGCHVGTPDGSYVAYVDSWPWSAVFAGISPSNTGQALPNYLGATCTSWNNCTGSPRTFMQYPWGGGLAMSAAHWPSDATTGERIAIMATELPSADTVMPWNTDDYDAGNLVWIDTQSTAITMTNGQPWPTQGTAYGYMQHTGDLGGVAFPTWSNDGNTIVYASSAPSPSLKGPAGQTITGDQDGRLSQGATDLYSVLYNDKAGGVAAPVPGASSSALYEYYPAFSPDDSMIAFTAIPSGPSQVMYANPQAELYVVPFGAPEATPVRLNANDPPSCTGMTSPGINNHWPKWAPDVENGNNGKTYYWLIFSSNRYGTPPVTTSSGGTTTTVQVSQLYITAIVQNELTTATYPSIYLYNQPADRLNTTPAWQDFHIPIVIDKP